MPRSGRGRRQINFEGLEDHGNVALNLPDLLLLIWCEQLLGLADDGGADIGGGRMDDASFVGEKHDAFIQISHISEVRVLGLVLLFVGGDGPRRGSS